MTTWKDRFDKLSLPADTNFDALANFIQSELDECRNDTIEDCYEIIPWLWEDVDEEVSRLLTSLKIK
jgi:hypothetical protein